MWGPRRWGDGKREWTQGLVTQLRRLESSADGRLPVSSEKCGRSIRDVMNISGLPRRECTPSALEAPGYLGTLCAEGLLCSNHSSAPRPGAGKASCKPRAPCARVPGDYSPPGLHWRAGEEAEGGSGEQLPQRFSWAIFAAALPCGLIAHSSQSAWGSPVFLCGCCGHWPLPAFQPRGEQPHVLDEVRLQVHLSREPAPAAARLPGPPRGCSAASCPHSCWPPKGTVRIKALAKQGP